jgi:hypothetical protein
MGFKVRFFLLKMTYSRGLKEIYGQRDFLKKNYTTALIDLHKNASEAFHVEMLPREKSSNTGSRKK